MNNTNPGGTAASTTLALILGAGLGMVAGLLFAPRSGQETRNRLRQKAWTARETMRKEIEEQKERARQAANQMAESSKSAIEKGQEAIRAGAEGTARSTRASRTTER